MLKSSPVKIFIIVFIFVLLALFVGGIYHANNLGKTSTAKLSITPTPAIKSTQVNSLVGTKKLLMQEKNNSDGTTTYTFSVADISGKNPIELFTKTVAEGEVMEIHGNSWSPDDKYVYVVEKDKKVSHVYVFQTSGEAFADGQQYVDVVPVFTERKPEYTFNEITGWASPTLLYVTSASQGNNAYQPFWFEVTTKAIMQVVRR